MTLLLHCTFFFIVSAFFRTKKIKSLFHVVPLVENVLNIL
jgi:hypothetical protein